MKIFIIFLIADMIDLLIYQSFVDLIGGQLKTM